MPASRKRIPFSAAGPFLVRKNFTFFAARLTIGMGILAEVLEGLHFRRIEQLYSANYIDMLPADFAGKVHTKAEALAADPLDRDGDGDKGGSLSDAELAALAQAGLTLDDWLKLPEPERVTALAAALAAAVPSLPAGGETGGPAGGEGGAGAPEAATQAQSGAAGPEPAAEAPAGPVAAYKAFGFGRYAAVDAAGNKVGDYMVKGTAAGLAARDRVPLLNSKGEPFTG
jgi:hypothetical protein